MDNNKDNRIFVILLSLFWGVGLALIFRKVCTNDQCIVVKVPHVFDESNKMIYDKNNRCYKLVKYDSPCAY